MLKRLFLFACLSSSAFCFERGAELFEKKDYLESAQTFLIEAKKNDVRVPFYVRFLSENALINPQDLGEALEQDAHSVVGADLAQLVDDELPLRRLDIHIGELLLVLGERARPRSSLVSGEDKIQQTHALGLRTQRR